jgi:hypothetical protein
MRSVAWTALMSVVFVFKSFSQVDTTFIYNTNTPYGTLDIRIAKSNTRYYFLQENSTFSFRENSGARTNTFADMTAWDSSPYAEGHLREKIDGSEKFIMNYRLLKPGSYTESYSKGFPLLIMMHGSGERGNCWRSNCYHATSAYDPNVNDPPAPTSPDEELLNNDHNLIHGGKFFLDAVTKAGTMLPDNAALPIGAFPGLVLFPQNLNGWSGDAVQDMIRIVRLLVKKYNIDEDRIYITGLSNGGHGVYQALKRAPWLFSSAILMSAIDDGFITSVNMQSEIAHVPLWIFQGELDQNPAVNETRNFVKKFRDAGAVIRYTEYAGVGHTTWNLAFKEPDYIPWLLGHNMGSVHVFAGSPTICGGNGTDLKLPDGFYAYQWEKNGQIISGESSAVYNARTPGNYRGRFSRISSTPSEAQWNDWSPIVEVKTSTAPSTSIVQYGTAHLRDLNGTNEAKLEAAGDFAHYYWYKNGVLVDLPGDQDDTVKTFVIKPGTCSSNCTNNGLYTLQVANFDNCKSQPTQGRQVYFSDQAPLNITAGTEFTATKGAGSAVTLQWKDNATNESGYEIWRRHKIGENPFSMWEMATLTNSNATSYTDTKLLPTTTYQYKIRAVGIGGRSNYTPADINQAIEIVTGQDTQKPTVPANLILRRTGIESARLTWSPSTDDSQLANYVISYEDAIVNVPATDTAVSLTSLKINSTYNFTVTAVDVAGNSSDPSKTLVFISDVTGLFYEHSPGYWPSLDSVNFSNPEYVGFVRDFTLREKTQDDFFYFRFDGFLYVETPGSYSFRLSSNDGSRLYLKGSRIIDNNGLRDDLATKTSSAQNLVEGPNRLTVEFFEYSEADSLAVEYQGPDTNNEWILIPASALRSSLVTAVDPSINHELILNVFPNPSRQEDLRIQLESLHQSPVRITMLDPIGRAVHSADYHPDELRDGISLLSEARKLPSGVYFIRAKQGTTVSLRKVIIR